METKKKVSLNLEGIDGNAFSIMGAFRKQARREGWKLSAERDLCPKCALLKPESPAHE